MDMDIITIAGQFFFFFATSCTAPITVDVKQNSKSKSKVQDQFVKSFAPAQLSSAPDRS